MVNHIHAAIQCVGNKGQYQKILMVFLILAYIQLGFILLGAPFYYMNPIFQCENDPGIWVDATENQACDKLQSCRITNDFTITSYAELICDKQSERNLIQSAPYIGSIFGLLVITPFASEKGTKKIFMLGYFLAIFGVCLNLLGAFTKFTAAMIAGQMIMGTGAYTYLILGFVIISELSQQKFKQHSITTLNAVWALAEILISVFYFWANQWQYYLIFVLVIPNIALFIFGFFFMIESPYYHIEKQRSLEKAMIQMKKIAFFNGASEQSIKNAQNHLELALQELQQKDRESNNTQSGTVSRFAIFKDWQFLKILLIVAVLELGLNMYYYGVQFSLGKIGTNFGYNVLLAGTIQSIAYFSSNFFITKIPRRLGMFSFNIVCIALGLLFFIQFESTVQTVLLGACRFFNTYSLSIVPMMQNEPFPHKYRAMAWGYIQGISQIGNFAIPYIVTGCQNAGINPLIVLSFILCVIGIFPLLYYKETLGKSEINEQPEDLKISLRTQVEQSLRHSQVRDI